MSSPRLVTLATAVPRHVVRREDVRPFASRLFSDLIADHPRLLDVFDNTEIETRNVCMPLDWYGEDHDFGERNTLYVEHAVTLTTEAVRRSLARARLSPGDVDHLVFVSTTGVATPSIDARVANILELRGDVRRTPVWGLGCAGGAAGLSRARDLALADPAAVVVVVATELCTLTFLRNDISKRNFIAASLFADGAAAAVVAGAERGDLASPEHAPLEVMASKSIMWRDTLDVMGWDVDGDGLHVVFSRDIPTIVRERVPPSLADFLAPHGLRAGGIDHLAAHPGGVKVLRAYAESLGLPHRMLDHASAVLREHGNMSAPTCLFVLERILASGDLHAGHHALVTALGPGFSAEYVLLRAAGA